MRKVSLAILAAAILSVAAFAVWRNANPKPENLQLTPAQWSDDLHFIARELPKRHANALHFTSKDAFENAGLPL
jgi:hypothetical protein